MEADRTVLISVLKASPPKTVIDVLRQIKSTLNAVKITTIEPRALLNAIEPELPEAIRAHVATIMAHEDLFDHIWDELIITVDPGKTWCCFSA
jgi:hypothetical protein